MERAEAEKNPTFSGRKEIRKQQKQKFSPGVQVVDLMHYDFHALRVTLLKFQVQVEVLFPFKIYFPPKKKKQKKNYSAPQLANWGKGTTFFYHCPDTLKPYVNSNISLSQQQESEDGRSLLEHPLWGGRGIKEENTRSAK